MEKGQMRIEVNISLSDSDKLGTKVELKNINSFRAVENAIAYEIERQTKLLEKGDKVRQETRGWDDAKQKTVSQRSKEEAHDYRYFPEPDIPPFSTEIFRIENLKAELPELPKEKRLRFASEYNLSEKQAELLVGEPAFAEFFEEAISELKEKGPGASSELLFNYLTSDIRWLMNETGVSFEKIKVTPERLAHLMALIGEGKIMSRQAKDILRRMMETGEDPENILEAEGLHTVSDQNELAKIVKEVLEENPAAVSDYKKGKEASLQFMIGMAMKKLRGRGNPGILKELFAKELA
jgi:aspartyl-tRNA(Asn)/glutamyl-tRNA(Gln) amidotransferase subunit B